MNNNLFDDINQKKRREFSRCDQMNMKREEEKHIVR